MWRALAERNILICALLGILLVSYLVVCWAFMPLYLIHVRHYDAQTMGWLNGTLGILATLVLSWSRRCPTGWGGARS